MSKEFTPEEYNAWHAARPKKMVVVKGILKSADGTILIAKPTYKKTWQLPGGGVDAGESPEDALVREVFEEFGKTISQSALQVSGTVHKAADDTLFILYEYQEPIDKNEVFILPSDELEKYEFVRPEELAARLPDYYGVFIEQYRHRLINHLQ